LPSLRANAADNCVACHMPKGELVDVGHTVFTDHSIPRRAPRPTAPGGAAGTLLRDFWRDRPDARAEGLAYAEVSVQSQVESHYTRAFELLKKADADGTADAEVLLQLGYLYDRRNDEENARVCYERALQANPAQVIAALNLGRILARRNDFPGAIRLWNDALARNPGLGLAGVYLALAHLRLGDIAAAEAALLKALEYDPDLPPARRLLSQLRQRRK
jgi:tetratricopeptide (TPR) repeat protein